MEPRRSSRIQEIAARQKVKEAERVAKLEAESRVLEQPMKANTTLKRKRPGQKLPSKVSGSVAKTEAAAEGEDNLPAGTERPEKKQKTAPQQNEAGAEFQDMSADQEQDTAPPREKKSLADPASVAEGQNTAPQQDEASTEFQHKSTDKEEEVAAPLVEGRALVQQTVVNKNQGITPQQDEAGAVARDKTISKEGQVNTPLVEEQAVVEQAAFEQAVVNEDQDTTLQHDGVAAELQEIPGDREGRVNTSLAEVGVSVEEDHKATSQQNGASTEVRMMPSDPKEKATPPLIDKQASVDECEKFVKVLDSNILSRRQLRRKNAARRKCLKERFELEWLLDYNWSQLANVPPEETFLGVRDKVRADIERFERNLYQRQEQEFDPDRDIRILNQNLDLRKRRMDDLMTAEMPPDTLPPSMRNSADFQAAYRYCRELIHTVKGIEARLRNAEQQREATLDKFYDHAEQILLTDTARAESKADFDEVKSHDRALRDASGSHAQCLELEQDASRTKMMCSAQKLALATLAENDLIERGMLQQCVSDGDESTADPEDIEQQKTSKQAAAEPSDFEKLKAEREAAKAELMAAQAHLCTAYKEFQGRRNLTEDEIAQLPKTITEDDIGLELQMKLMRTTRNYIEAQERVRTAQAEGRCLGVPGVDKYPIDQTWDFEDRPDDGYAESAIADRMEKSKPRVNAWLSQLAMSGKSLSPSTIPQAPKKDPDFVVELGELRLGDDKAEDFSSDGAKERIARYQKACGDPRDSGLFPLAVPDRFISKERWRELDSHMI
jgi:hypothetical protein